MHDRLRSHWYYSRVRHVLSFMESGRNGKGTFMNALTGILGEYARTAPVETFMASAMERHPTDLAGLFGARLVVANE